MTPFHGEGDSAIPALVDHGPAYPHRLLPPGAHFAPLDEIRRAFAVAYPRSTTRRAVMDGLAEWLAEGSRVGVSATHWIDGSFVEGKLNPEDVDVWTFCRLDELDGMTPDARAMALGLWNGGDATVARFRCHAFIGLIPSGKTEPSDSLRLGVGRLWGHTRSVDKDTGEIVKSAPKGFLVATTGERPPVIETRGIWA